MQKLILGLVGLNVVLATSLTLMVAGRTSSRRAVVSADASSSTVATSGAAHLNPTLSDKKRPSTARDAIWKTLASNDLRRYAANLRRVGCPEETIQEILLAAVNRLYEGRERALKVRPEDVPLWEQGSQRDRRAAEGKLRQLLTEKRGLLKELTGMDTGISMPTQLAGRDVEKFEGAFAALPDSTRDQVRTIQENYWAQSDAIKQQTMGYLEPEDRDEFNRIKTERRQALAQILSPPELEDYEMQTSATAPSLRSRMEGFAMSDDEFRKVFDFMQPLDEQYSLSRRNPDPQNQEFTTARNQAEKDLQDYIHQVLGDDRYAEYQRTRDPVYRNLSQAGAEAGVPQETIVQAYQAQQQMQQDAMRVMQDPNLTPEQRAQSLQEMRALAQQKLQQVFGDKANQLLQQWQLNQLGGPKPARRG
jgi:hypothetical protein